MKNRVLAVLTAVLSLSALAAPTLPAVHADDSYTMTVAVDLTAGQKKISPYIYGINDAGKLDDVTVTAVRQGGNRYSAYNWENNFSNAGADWKNNSDTYLINGFKKDLAAKPGAPALKLSQDCVEHDVPYKMATIQMAGYVSADGDGPVTEAEKAPSTRWKEVKATKGSEFSLTPDTTDDYVYMDEYVNYLVKTLGDSTTKEGINGYNLDNEPGLWDSTHKLMHPDNPSYKEMVEKSTAYASAIKSVDPKAEVYGLALFGVYSYYNFCDAPDKDSNYAWFLDYYLDKMNEAEKTAGKRLIDAIDVHYYSEAKGDARVTETSANTDKDKAARVQAPRTLYEAGYKENSWLVGTDCEKFMPYLQTIQKSIDTYYPGTKLAMTEYNFGGGMDSTGAIAECDALGAFAANNVYLATLWPLADTIDYQLSALNLYTNYDGKGGKFGDTLVEAKTDDIEKSYAYASINGTDTSKVTVVMANKDSAKTEKATLDIKGGKDYKSAVVYAVTMDGSDIRVLDVQNDLSGAVTVELPPYSVATVVLSDKNSDEKVYVEPEKTTKEVVVNVADLKTSKDGGYLIPIEDPEHLVKAIINTTVSCSTNSEWFGGGGALCFSELEDESGKTVWGSKAFSYNAGTGDAVVKFDGTYTIYVDNVSEDIQAVNKGKTMELQNWWKSSKTSDKGDDVTVVYNTVTLVYDYAGTEMPTDPQNPTEPATQTPTTATTEPTTQETTTPASANEDVYKFADLKKDKDGNWIVPVKDASKIEKVIINTTASCTSKTDWYGGGGGLCFAQLKSEDGTTFWGYKDFMYGADTGDVTVEFDGEFTMPPAKDGEEATKVKASSTEKQMIVQDWWKSSNADKTGADVSVTYNTITVVYADTTADTTAPTTSEQPAVTIYGDINGDGAVDILDVIAVNKFLLGVSKPDAQGQANADVNADNKVDSDDALNILKRALEMLLEADFPVK